MTPPPSRPCRDRLLRSFTWCLACCLALALLAGCGLMRGPEPGPTPPRPAEQSLQQRAEKAWNDGNFGQSAQLYRDLADQPGLTPVERSHAWERAVLSAIQNGQFNLALEYIPGWRRAVPGVVEQPAWQDAYFRALDGLGDPGIQETELLALSSDESLPWEMRARAGIELAVLHWSRGDVRRPQMILSLIHQQAKQQGQPALAAIEGMLLNALPKVGLQDLEAFGLLVPEEDRTAFPYTVVELEKARRLATTPGGRSQAITLVQRVAPFLADRTLAQKVLRGDAGTEQADQAVALALPLTGPYAEVASKILRGAMAARKDLQTEGIAMDVQVVNTDAGSWQQDMAALPEQVAVVGGPLRVDVFKQLTAAGLHNSRAVFAFLSGLGSVKEGADAWRFFTSAEDQIRTLVDTARYDFGVQNTAVLYPEDSYGMHMAQLFRQEAMGQRLAVNASESYSPRDSSQWSDIVARIARSGAGSVFIPGDWNHAEQLAPYLPYHDAGDMLIMGPSIWGPSIDRKGYVEISTFSKAFFPGPWWPENHTPAAMALKRRMQEEGQAMPDFWVALGYDFVRFAAQLQLAPGWTPETVNQRIQAAQGMSWSQAPIVWDSTGKAAQQLFALRLTQNGYTQVEPTRPAPYSQEQPAPYGQKQPVPYGQEQPVPYGQEQPVPYSQEQPAPYGQEQPATGQDIRYAVPPSEGGAAAPAY